LFGQEVTDNVDKNLGLKTFLNGTLVSNIVIDTSTAGNTATSTRTVVVAAPDSPESPTGFTSTRTIIIEASNTSPD
jgi:hypothetical protein